MLEIRKTSGKSIKIKQTWQALKSERRKYSIMLKEAKNQIYSDLLECGKNTKKLYKLINNWTGSIKLNPLPDDLGSDEEMADSFADVFVNKIKNIRNVLDGKYKPPVRSVKSELLEFKRVSTDEVRKYIMEMPTN